MSTSASENPATKICPYCAEEIKEAAIKCRFCGSMLGARPGSGEWHREMGDKMVGGVCSGLARQFGVPVTALRVAFAIATFIGGWGLLVYLVLWVIMPVRPRSTSTCTAVAPASSADASASASASPEPLPLTPVPAPADEKPPTTSTSTSTSTTDEKD